jgi:ankyrin repeat protein
VAAGASMMCTDEKGSTPLHLACIAGHTEVVSLLVAAGASMSCTDEKGHTPLDLVCMAGHTEVVSLLVH